MKTAGASKDFNEVFLLLPNFRITNHIDRHQSVIMLRKFSDSEFLYVYSLLKNVADSYEPLLGLSKF